VPQGHEEEDQGPREGQGRNGGVRGRGGNQEKVKAARGVRRSHEARGEGEPMHQVMRRRTKEEAKTVVCKKEL
jgi:hypothetical protein